MHIPKSKNELILSYWDNCCGDSKNLKIVHGLVIFTNFMNGEKVTKEFKVTGDSIYARAQYVDKKVPLWKQRVPGLITIGSKSNRISFCEDSELFIFSVKSM